MTRLLAVLACLWASGAASENVTFLTQGGDTFELRRGEVFLELIYTNSHMQDSKGGRDELELDGVKVIVHVSVSAKETLTVRVPDPGLFPEIETIDVADGEKVTVRIMPALF